MHCSHWTNALFPVGVSTPKFQFIPQFVQEPKNVFLWLNSHQIVCSIRGWINLSLVWIGFKAPLFSWVSLAFYNTRSSVLLCLTKIMDLRLPSLYTCLFVFAAVCFPALMLPRSISATLPHTDTNCAGPTLRLQVFHAHVQERRQG